MPGVPGKAYMMPMTCFTVIKPTFNAPTFTHQVTLFDYQTLRRVSGIVGAIFMESRRSISQTAWLGVWKVVHKMLVQLRKNYMNIMHSVCNMKMKPMIYM